MFDYSDYKQLKATVRPSTMKNLYCTVDFKRPFMNDVLLQNNNNV